jgi:hypothetical protein
MKKKHYFRSGLWVKTLFYYKIYIICFDYLDEFYRDRELDRNGEKKISL